MLKKMSIKKIIVSTTAIILLLVIYLIPSNRKDIDLKNNSIEYNYNNVESTIYLVDSNDYVARTTIPTCKCEGVDLAKDLLEGLVVGGTKNNIIPNGFRSIIPPDVTIKDLKLQEGVLTINFSKELLDINEKDENKMLEAIIYTLTSIDGIDKVIIKVEGEVLNKLPNSKTNIPTVLNKSYGINKSYDLSNLNDILSYTTYYTSTYNDTKYYVPVTKYINSKDSDVVKIIIKELGSSPIYQTNLMSYLNANTVLNDYKQKPNFFSEIKFFYLTNILTNDILYIENMEGEYHMENKKIKIYGIVLGVILFIILVAGFTYAALTWRSSNITITGASECLEVDSVKGSNITGSDLLLLDENQIINNNRITITSGMVVTNITAKLKSSCTLDGYLTINLKTTTLNSGFTSSGNSTGALKYVLTSYDPSTYTTINTSALNGKTFDILTTGSITSTGTLKIKEAQLSKDTTLAYLVIFYIDGDKANNDIGSNSTNFKTSIEGSVTQGTISG